MVNFMRGACRGLCRAALLAGVLGLSVTAGATEYGKPEPVVGPIPYLGVHGLGITPDGRLVAGSVVGQSISVVDRGSGAVSTLIGPPQGMADDIAFGPDGQMAWTSFQAGIIRAKSPYGDARVLATGLPGINSLDYTEDGRLFATQVFLGDALYEIDPTGRKPPRKIKENLGGLNGFEIRNGWIYGPLWFKGKVVRVNVDTGEMQTVADGFKTPAAANFDSKGNLYVVDTQTGVLTRVDVKTGEKTQVAQLKPSLDNLAIDAQDHIYVSNMADDSVQEVNPDTGEVRTLVSSKLASPSGLALVGNTMYIGDVFAFRTMDIGTGEVGEVARMWASHIEYPLNANATEDSVVLSSWATSSVQVYDRSNMKLTRSLGDFKAPQGALQLDDGSLLVAEMGTGKLLHVTGEKGEQRTAVVDGLQGPAGVARSKDGKTLYLTTAAGRIWAIDMADWSKRRVTDGLKLPEGIDLTPAGKLVVMEAGARRILEVDTETGDASVVAENLPVGLPQVKGLPPTGVFNDVVAADNGDLYYTADVKAGLYRIPRR